MDSARIASALAELRRLDRTLSVFGASTHRYVLAPPMPAAEAESFERTHSVALPDDYRRFLLSLGNGGAGPFYGVFPLGQMDSGFDLAEWTEGDGFVGRLASPFPYSSAWNLPESELTPPEEFGSDEAEGAWHEALDAKYWRPIDGAIPLCHHGCAERTWLVVSGPERGHVWFDARAENGGWKPHASREAPRLTFSGWYQQWLDDSLAQLRR